ncbi:MAG TPA: FAD-dependent oxidoreductase, partial [Clostridia bacterium]
MKKVLIVGGVAGGASAAARLRRLDEHAKIILFERGEYISYANCGLPYYIGDVIKEQDELLVQTPEAMRSRFDIDVRVNSEIVGINRKDKTVRVREAKTGLEYDETYDNLILSPGARPFVPRIEGRDLPGVFTLRNVPDTLRIREYVDSGKVHGAVVVGGGFIGVEMAENLRERGVSVTMVEALDQVMAPFDPEMAALLQANLKQNGIALTLGAAISGIRLQDGKLQVVLDKGEPILTDMVVLSIGVRPESELARESGLDIGERGGIRVDSHQRTSDPDIYAVGDAAETHDLISGKDTLLPLAGPANRQGRTAADNIAGASVRFEGVVGSSIIKVFDLTAASTGYNEKNLKRSNIAYEKTYIHPLSHAGYYPGSQQMTLKLLFSTETRKILGAQAIGYDGVDKRIDVIATALKLGATVDQLQNLELCYAPPFSSAKDPVNMAGFTAVNILDGLTHVMHWHDIDSLDHDRFLLLDVRTREEFDLGHIEGAVNLPVDDLRAETGTLPKDKSILVYCKVGLRGYVAERILKQSGFENVFNLSGGYKLYSGIKEAAAGSSADCQGYQHKTGDGSEESAAKAQDRPKSTRMTSRPVATLTVNAKGLQCPGPILKVTEGVKSLTTGDILEISATDPSFGKDVEAWCLRT